LELETSVEHIRVQDATVTLSIRQNNQSKEVKARRCILTAPFSILRQGILKGVPLSEAKYRAIQELDLGTNAKIAIGVSKRFWQDEKSSGEIFTDLSFQSCWDSSRGQSGTSGILTNYRGGSVGKAVTASKAQELAREVLQDLAPLFSRSAPLPSLATTEVSVADWPKQPLGGSYSTYKVGQMIRFGGAESEPEGPLHFAGEHTSAEFQGFMEGAAESGLRAAKEVAAALSLKIPVEH
jgi:monoamine oxidase